MTRKKHAGAITPGDDGELFMEGMRGVFVPTDYLVSLAESLRTLLGQSSAVLYNMGIRYGRRTVRAIRDAEGGASKSPRRRSWRRSTTSPTAAGGASGSSSSAPPGSGSGSRPRT